MMLLLGPTPPVTSSSISSRITVLGGTLLTGLGLPPVDLARPPNGDSDRSTFTGNQFVTPGLVSLRVAFCTKGPGYYCPKA
jgi:hypothetical protein